MRILQVIPSLADGGAERFVVDLCNTLSTNDTIILCVLGSINERAIFKKYLNDNVRVISLNKKPGIDLSIPRKLKRLINDFRPDVVHTHVRAINYLFPLVLFTARRFKIVHTVHNEASKEVNGVVEKYIRFWLYKKKRAFPVTISNASDKSFRNFYPGVPTNMIYNGREFPSPSTDVSNVKSLIKEYKVNDETKVLIHIGRMEPQKNHEMLISVTKRLVSEGENIILLLIGGMRNNSESKRIMTEISAVDKTFNIYYLGGGKHTADYLAASDFLCMPSLYEGMPISIIEAMASGCIPVCTPVGGMPEMIEGCGFLSEDTTAESYYFALKHAISISKNEQDQMQKLCNQLYQRRFSMNICANSYKVLYAKLVQ